MTLIVGVDYLPDIKKRSDWGDAILNRVVKASLAVLAVGALSACQTAAEHVRAVEKAKGESGFSNLNVGTVQREVWEGMSGAEVASVLGSPNIVTTDENRREVWIYDKISTDSIHSSNSGGVNLLIIGHESSSGARFTSQKTLTMIIKFDETKKVRDFAYHTSRF